MSDVTEGAPTNDCREREPEPTYALVFEGGGAKGIAYVAALAAIEERELPIGATAGASAGAITAALVAAGYDSAELRSKIPEGLQQLGRQLLTGSRSRMLWQWLIEMGPRLSTTGAAFDTSGLREWLTCLLEEKKNELLAKPSLELPSDVVATLKRIPGDHLTFAQLFRLTNIELFVVAANVSRSEEIVFHHETTPKCQVVDAVLASSAIPGALPSGKLEVDEPNRLSHQRRIHTIVDGGVWSNYPEFVFKDAAFRTSQGLGPLRHTVIGLILDESVEPDSGSFESDQGNVDDASRRYRTATFTASEEKTSLPRHEAVLAEDAIQKEAMTPFSKDWVNRVMRIGAMSKWRWRLGLVGQYLIVCLGILIGLLSVFAVFVAPIFWSWFRSDLVMLSASLLFLLVFVGFRFVNSPPEAAPDKATKFSIKARRIEDAWPRNRIMSTIRPIIRYFNPYIAWIPLLAIAFMTVKIAVDLDAAPMVPRAGLDFVAPVRGLLWFVGVFSGFGLIAFCVLTVWALFWGGRAAGDVGWGVLKTYFAGPGAPPWRGRGDDEHIIRIPIGGTLGTLSFNVDTSDTSEQGVRGFKGLELLRLTEFLEQTRAEVERQLDKILPQDPEHT